MHEKRSEHARIKKRGAKNANHRANDLHGLGLRGDNRSRLAASLFAIAQQHQSAILILISNQPPIEATAFSLLRLLLETTIRGAWVSHCATEIQLKNIVDGTQKQIDMASIFTSVTCALNKEAGHNSNVKSLYDNHWKTLSAYTHGYEQQVERWMVTKDIEPSYSVEDVKALIYLSDVIAKLAFICTQELVLDK